MKNMKKLLFTITLLVSAQVFAMEAPPSMVYPEPTPRILEINFNTLPKEIQRLLVLYAIDWNEFQVAKTILSLNHTNRFLRDFVRSENGMIKILEEMPYTVNAIHLIHRLQSNPNIHKVLPVVIESAAVKQWVERAQARLEPGEGINGASLASVKKELLNKNIMVDRNVDGFTALTRATMAGNAETAKMLIKAGANPNFRHAGQSPLLHAAINGKVEVVQLLLDAGADPEIRNAMCETVCTCVRKFESQPIGRDLVDQYAEIIALLERAIIEKKQQKIARICVIS